MLRDYIDKLCSESNEINESLNKENLDFNKKCKELEIIKKNQEEILNKKTSESEGIKSQNAHYSEKIKTLENTLKNKIDINIEFEIKNKELNIMCNSLEEKISNCENEKLYLIGQINQLNNQISELEKENIDLLKKNKVFLISQENFQTEIVKINQVSYIMLCFNTFNYFSNYKIMKIKQKIR